MREDINNKIMEHQAQIKGSKKEKTYINHNLMDPLKVFRSSIWTGVH